MDLFHSIFKHTAVNNLEEHLEVMVNNLLRSDGKSAILRFKKGFSIWLLKT